MIFRYLTILLFCSASTSLFPQNSQIPQPIIVNAHDWVDQTAEQIFSDLESDHDGINFYFLGDLANNEELYTIAIPEMELQDVLSTMTQQMGWKSWKTSSSQRGEHNYNITTEKWYICNLLPGTNPTKIFRPKHVSGNVLASELEFLVNTDPEGCQHGSITLDERTGKIIVSGTFVELMQMMDYVRKRDRPDPLL